MKNTTGVCTAYLFKFPNDKYYVGITTDLLSERIKGHKNKCFNPNGNAYMLPLYKAIRYYGWDNVEITVICECSEKDLDAIEIAYIKKYNSLIPNGYNVSAGGRNGAQIMTPAIKEQISNSLKVYYAENLMSDESKLKKSISGKKAHEEDPTMAEHSRVTQLLRYKSQTAKKETSDAVRKATSVNYEITKDLPTYVILRQVNPKQVYRIRNHPLCISKSFSSGTSEENRVHCVDYVNTLNFKYNIPVILVKITEIIETNNKIIESINNLIKNYIFSEEEQGSETK